MTLLSLFLYEIFGIMEMSDDGSFVFKSSSKQVEALN